MDFGQNLFEWLQSQFIYIGWAVLGAMILWAFIKKASTQFVVVLVLGGIAMTIISAPENVGDLGQSLWNTIFG